VGCPRSSPTGWRKLGVRTRMNAEPRRNAKTEGKQMKNAWTEEVDRLRASNEALKKENSRLLQMLINCTQIDCAVITNLKQQVEKKEERVKEIDHYKKTIICSFCGYEQERKEDHNETVLIMAEHMMSCKNHPLRLQCEEQVKELTKEIRALKRKLNKAK
jgi:hypothetical protein